MIPAHLKFVKIAERGKSCFITINRPEKKNALNDILINDLKDAFNYANNSFDNRVVILNSESDAFCSGADLKSLYKMKDNSFEENFNDSKNLTSLYEIIYRLNKPVIAAVNGAALAGGCGLASVCDFILAGPKAVFGYPEVKIGFIPAIVSGYLIKQIGERKARYLLLSGKTINGSEAQNIGLVTKFLDEENRYYKEIDDLCELLILNSEQAMSKIKYILNSDYYFNIEKLAEENAKFRSTESFQKGLEAFLDKRKQTW
ncbi:MAG: enoyl-CoA hydratase/isomerase family protein [Calditrichae bacterium]|nr:enoyl-CoA hydratase/isomerase family protein [Calditrichia bacterium]